MKSLFETYAHWIEIHRIEKKGKWFFSKKISKILCQGREFNTESELTESYDTIFEVFRSIQTTGYEMTIQKDYIQLEPNLAYGYHVPNIKFKVTNMDLPNRIYENKEAMKMVIMKFTDQYLSYISKQYAK